MSTSTPASTWTPFVRDDVYMGRGNNEDGECREELAFYVVCENEKGVRYASKVSFTTEESSRDYAQARAERLCKATEAALAAGADPTKSAKWARTRSAYGSAAWSEAEELCCEADELESEAGVQEADRFRVAKGLV